LDLDASPRADAMNCPSADMLADTSQSTPTVSKVNVVPPVVVKRVNGGYPVSSVAPGNRTSRPVFASGPLAPRPMSHSGFNARNIATTTLHFFILHLGAVGTRNRELQPVPVIARTSCRPRRSRPALPGSTKSVAMTAGVPDAGSTCSFGSTDD